MTSIVAEIAEKLNASGETLKIDTSTLVLDALNNRVGIGTDSPATALDVAGTITGTGLNLSGTISATTFDTNVTTAAVTLSGTTLAADGTDTNIDINIIPKGTGVLFVTGDTGDIRATGDITAFYSSDKRLKENIVPITGALEKLERISGVEFDWTDDFISTKGGQDDYFLRKHDVGVIAQELQEVLPEVVGERQDGYLAVKYDRIVPLLIQAIKELKTKIEKSEQ